MKPKITVVLYKSKTLASGEHPLMLRIAAQGQRQYVALGISSPDKWWDHQKKTPKRSHPNRDFIKTLIEHKIRAYQQAILDHKRSFKSIQELIHAVEHPTTSRDLLQFLDELVERWRTAGRIGNANVYMDAKRALKRFVKDDTLPFDQVDHAFLGRYEAFLRSRGLADTSLSVYFRTLRAIFNKAIKEGIVTEEIYPFKEFSIAKFSTATKKRAITKAEIRRLAALALDPEGTLYQAQTFFLFSYYGQGINFRDMALLRWKDLVGDRIFYLRAKTKQLIQFKLLEPARHIIERYRPLTGDRNQDYIFPILDAELHRSPQQIDNRLDKVLKRTNLALKEMAAMAGIKTHLTMYVARHSYATVLKRSGVAIPVISEAMGHSTPVVTQTYLKSFEDEVIDEANTFLL